MFLVSVFAFQSLQITKLHIFSPGKGPKRVVL